MILFKYLLIAKLTVPIELNLMTGRFFLHFIEMESENIIFSKSANMFYIVPIYGQCDII